MSKVIYITLNNSGSDPGPYNLFLIDGSGNSTAWPSNPITKTILTAGYQMIVPDLIVKVKVRSISGKCDDFYKDLTIPLVDITTSTTSTTSTSSTTTSSTSTTTSTSTSTTSTTSTTTTTTSACVNMRWSLSSTATDPSATVTFTLCNGDEDNITVLRGGLSVIKCIQRGQWDSDIPVTPITLGDC